MSRAGTRLIEDAAFGAKVWAHDAQGQDRLRTATCADLDGDEGRDDRLDGPDGRGNPP